MKELDLTKSVSELVGQYPELKDIMAGLGFTEIIKKAMLNSVGRIMTIPKGAKMKNIPMETILAAFAENGFTVPGADETEEKPQPETTVEPKAVASDSRTERLKGYLRRLGEGEDIESVRADFAAHFSDVEASEIMRAEQELMAEGTPLEEVQKLCDLHSALFHGATREEKIMNAEKAVGESLKREQASAAPVVDYSAPEYANKEERAAALAAIPGHPLHTFTRENEALAPLLDAAKAKLERGGDAGEDIGKIRELSIHYAKKGDLLYPQLDVKYDITGPSAVMWTVDDEIRDELAALAKDADHNAAWVERAKAVLKRAEEMIYKEKNILFPICAVTFSQEEWQGIYRDSKDYAVCLGVESGIWEPGEAEAPAAPAMEGEIVMPGGHMTLEQLTAMLNTIPVELTFVDADNMNRYFNEGPKVFKRPGMAIDREVFSCHPPKIEPMVRAIIDDFRNNRRDSVPVWMEKNGKTFLVTYMAVRNRAGTYLGTVEVVQDMEFAKEHFKQQN